MQRLVTLLAGLSLGMALSLGCGSREPSGEFASVSLAAGAAFPLLVAVGPGPTVSTSPDGVHWFDHPFLQGVSFLRNAAWNGSSFVGVGYASTGSGVTGTAVTSANGVDWTTHAVPVSGTLDAVAWNGAVFAAVGWGHTAASADGVTWTGQASTPFFSCVTAGGPEFVAVGPSGSAATSTDGVHWAAASVPPSGDFQAVAWNGTLFAAAGNLSGAGTVATSPDGSTWTTRSVPTGTGALAAVAWNGSMFVATGAQDTVLTSSDGITWTRRSIPSSGQTFKAVVWTGSAFVAIGNQAVAISTDGVTWTCSSVTGLIAPGATVGTVPALSLGAIDVRSGPEAGGTTVTIAGSNIDTRARVEFGGAAATLTGASSTSLAVTTPAHAVGTVDVVVINPDGQSSTLAAAYTYVAPPVITAIDPRSGSTAGGERLTINGSGFQENPTVTIGGATATVTAWTASSITVTLPPHAEGTVSVVVANADHQSSTLPDSYTYGPFPTPASVTPSAGFTSGGTKVTLTGNDFLEGATVTFGGVAATSVVVVSSTVITAVTPEHDVGPVDVVVRNSDGKSGTLAGGYTFDRSVPGGCGTGGGPVESLLGAAVLLAAGRIGAGRRRRPSLRA